MSAQPTDFELKFGRNNGGDTTNAATSGSTNAKDRPKAQIWINVGYEVDSRDKDGNPIVEFIALPTGIPLDTMDKVPANQRDPYFQKKQQASNTLLDRVNAMAKKMAPGEEKIIGERGSLQIQIRRVKAEAEIVDAQSNELIAELVL